MRAFVGALFFLGAVAFFGFIFLEKMASSPDDHTKGIVFEVNYGENLNQVLAKLQQARIIRSALWSKVYTKVFGLEKVRAGEYLIPNPNSADSIFRTLVYGKSIEYSFTIPEGYNIFEVASVLSTKGYGTSEKILKFMNSPAFLKKMLGDKAISIEGYLYPETYSYSKQSTLQNVLEKMVQKAKAELSSVQSPILKLYEVLILASIIEKETGDGSERPLISAVFHNRMTKRMKLQTDPTVIYGVWTKNSFFNGNITRKDLTTDTPYNTYTRFGLPPTPIANPGRAALQAAVKPDTTKYLYFVAKKDGTHQFSETYEQHLKYVRQYQLSK